MRRNGAARSGLLLAACVAAAALALHQVLPGIRPSATVIAAVACGLAALAVALAFAAWRRAGENESLLLALAHALDQTRPASSPQAPVPPPPLDIDMIASLVEREVNRLNARPDTDSGAASDVAAGASERDGPAGPKVPPLIPRPARRSPAGRQAFLSLAVENGTLDIALRPIVSLARGTAVAFDAFAEFGGDGEPFHLARLPAGTPVLDRARFETMLLSRAVDSTRRVMAGATDAPLHVPISRALFDTTGEAAPLIERLRAHQEASRAIVLDVPAGDLPVSATIPEVLDAFLDAGVRLCLDLTDVRAPDFLGIRRSGARQVRLPAQLLLGHATPRGQGPSGPDIAAAARDAGIEVIADNVSTDDEALSLVDFGIDLMSGPRFAPPRRLRDAAAPHPGRAAAE